MDIFIDRIFEKYYSRSPIVLIDVGARGGVQKNWDPAKRHLKVVGFEPDPKEYGRLSARQKKDTLYINSALYSKKGRTRFYLTRNRGVASIYEPDLGFLRQFPEEGRYAVEEAVEAEVSTLDEVLPANGIDDPDFIKLDTQGSELDILKGARGTLGEHILGLEVEVETVPLYKGQPLFSDVDAALRAAGFYLFDLRPFYWKRKGGREFGKAKGQMIFADALYLRRAEDLDAVAGGRKDEARKSKVLKAVSISLLYGYLDYALYIFEMNSELFDEKEKRAFHGRLEREVPLSRKIPNFRGRGRIANAFYSMYKVMHPEGKGWVKRGRALGNLE